MLTLFGTTALVVLVFVTLLFGLSIILRRNDIADTAWGAGIALVAWATYFLNDNPKVNLFILVLISLWALRLALHIGTRSAKHGEDPRYVAFRNSWGRWFYVRSYLQVFVLQGALMLCVGFIGFYAAAQTVAATPTTLSIYFYYLGFLVWCVGMFFEAVGDYQLRRFLAEPTNKGHVMTSGLWTYTRHPNYFGEVTLWWGLWLMTFTITGGWITILAPLTITFLILKVSGIPMLEARYVGNVEFESYKSRTNAFLPWWPKAK